MINLADIPAAWKFGTGGLCVVLSVMGYFSVTYYSRVEAQTYQSQHAAEEQAYKMQQASELVKARVSEIDRSISALSYRLLSEKLSDEQRAFTEAEVRRLEAEKQCIIDRKC